MTLVVSADLQDMYLCRLGRWSSCNNAGRVRYGETKVEASRITKEETCNK